MKLINLQGVVFKNEHDAREYYGDKAALECEQRAIIYLAEKQEEKVLSKWWLFWSMRLIGLWRKHNIQSF